MTGHDSPRQPDCNCKPFSACFFNSILHILNLYALISSFNTDIVNPNSFTRTSAWPITVRSVVPMEMKVIIS